MDEKFMLRLFASVVVIVLLGWFVAVVVGPLVADETYKPAPEINIVTMAIVGIFGTLYNKAKNSKSKGDDEE